MSHEQQGFPPVFRIDVSAEPSASAASVQYDPSAVMIALLRQVVQMQARTNQLLEELLQQHTASWGNGRRPIRNWPSVAARRQRL
jgi:hypothetical protein